MTTSPPVSKPQLNWGRTTRDMFQSAGFEPDGVDTCRRGPLTLKLDGRWLTFTADAAQTGALPHLSLRHLGLWKERWLGSYVCDVPEEALAAAELPPDEDNAGGRLASQVADWCLAALAGGVPEGWQPPSGAELVCLSRRELTVQQGGLLRPIELVREPQRLALRCVLAEVGSPLSASRRAWIERKVWFSHRQFRLVRIGFHAAHQRPTIEAEVDLTGCPGLLVRELLLFSLAALQQIVSLELPVFSVMCNPRVTCEAWES